MDRKLCASGLNINIEMFRRRTQFKASAAATGRSGQNRYKALVREHLIDDNKISLMTFLRFVVALLHLSPLRFPHILMQFYGTFLMLHLIFKWLLLAPAIGAGGSQRRIANLQLRYRARCQSKSLKYTRNN